MLTKISALLIMSSLAMIAQGTPVPSLNLDTTAFVISGEFLSANSTRDNFYDAATFASKGFVGKANFSIVVDALNNIIWA